MIEGLRLEGSQRLTMLLRSVQAGMVSVSTAERAISAEFLRVVMDEIDAARCKRCEKWSTQGACTDDGFWLCAKCAKENNKTEEN